MITINDNDLPIDVARKIITGTKVVELTSSIKATRKALTGVDEDKCTYDMFDLEEIKEIATYLFVYYSMHENGD